MLKMLTIHTYFCYSSHRKNPNSMQKKMISLLLACSAALLSAAQSRAKGDWVGKAGLIGDWILKRVK